MGWVPPSVARKRASVSLASTPFSEIHSNMRNLDAFIDTTVPLRDDEQPFVKAPNASRVRFSLDDKVNLLHWLTSVIRAVVM